MENINQENTNRSELSVEKPALEGIPIYIDGKLDKRHEIARYGAYTAKLVGYLAYKSLEATIVAFDDLLVEGEKRFR